MLGIRNSVHLSFWRLGDSVLVSSNFDAATFCLRMEAEGLYITTRCFPRTPDEYFAKFCEVVGTSFDHNPLSERQARRVAALEYGMAWLDDDEEKPRKKGPMPHLEFAIAIEAELPTRRNPRTGKDELYVREDGVWLPSGGDIKGELVADALLKVFAPRHWDWVDVEGTRKMRLVPGDIPLFRSGPALSAIGDMCKHLKFDPASVALDHGANIEKLKNFRGPLCVDFSVHRRVPRIRLFLKFWYMLIGTIGTIGRGCLIC